MRSLSQYVIITCNLVSLLLGSRKLHRPGLGLQIKVLTALKLPQRLASFNRSDISVRQQRKLLLNVVATSNIIPQF